MIPQTIAQPDPPRRITVAKLLRAMRLFSLPASVLPVFAATAAVLAPAEWRWDVLAASVAGVALLHLAGNLFNDYFDFASGVDRRTEDDEFRPGRLLVLRELLPRDVLVEALVCLLLGGAAAGYLVWRCGPAILGFAAAAGVQSGLWYLVIVLVATSVVGLFFYLRVIVALYLRPEGESLAAVGTDATGPSPYRRRLNAGEGEPSPAARDGAILGGLALAGLLAALLVLGVYPAPLIRLIEAAVAVLP